MGGYSLLLAFYKKRRNVSLKKYDWKRITEHLSRILHNDIGAVAFKFLTCEKELKNIKNAIEWPSETSACRIIGLSAYCHKTLILRADKLNFHCGGNCGTYKRGEVWKRGAFLSDICKWFTPEASKKHAEAQLSDVPPDGQYIALASALLESGDIDNPDVIVLSLLPQAAFYLLAGLIQEDFKEIDFKFRGESSCVETLGHTLVTGKPGLSLGCRGEAESGLRSDTVRLTMNADELVKALEGCDVLIRRSELIYPFFPGDRVDWAEM